MRKIVVGVDLSSSSEHALGHAVDAARHTGAEVVMVMVDVVPDVPPVVDPSSVLIAEAYTRTLAERLAAERTQLAELRERWQGRGAELSQLIVDGHADERLPAVAAELKADLIVVGSHGRTGVKRWLIGSVAERVVRLAQQSVLVARGEAPAGGYQRVVIGTDFSPGAEHALRRAIPLLAPDARLELVHGWAGPWSMPETAVLVHASMRTNLLNALTDTAERMASILREGGRGDVRINARLVNSSPAPALADVASEMHADLVVVGSHGRRGLRRLILGSVAEVTVRHAPCSVLVSR